MMDQALPIDTDLAHSKGNIEGKIALHGQDRTCPTSPILPTNLLTSGQDRCITQLLVDPRSYDDTNTELAHKTRSCPTSHRKSKKVKDYRKKRDHRNFMARTSDCYNNLKKRIQRKPSFALETLREIISVALLDKCRFCKQPLTIRNFSLDHSQPLSRGGTNEIDNLDVTCKKCNQAKGALTWAEFQALMVLIECWEPKARSDVLGRLKAGARRFGR